MTVTQTRPLGAAVWCRHPRFDYLGRFLWSDLRLYVPLKPGEEVKIDGMQPVKGGRFELGYSAALMSGYRGIRVYNNNLEGYRLMDVRSDLVRRAP